MKSQQLVSPAESWAQVMRLPLTEKDALEHLREAYRAHLPEVGELIFAGACEFTCEHCIYAPSFARFNRRMTLSDWKRVVGKSVGELGIRTFVYGGRSVTVEGLELLTWIRKSYPDAGIGLIDNGISMFPHREKLGELDLDWVDISLDGTEKDHDRQRKRAGSFRLGLEGALWLKEHNVAPKVNISTCLTTLNRASVIEMIRTLNELGFKNFFVIPVVIVRGSRPNAGLMLSGRELAEFLTELQSVVFGLKDACVEVNLFMSEYQAAVFRYLPELGRDMRPVDTHFRYEMDSSDTSFSVSYFPASLAGTRELIINTNGDIILPETMAGGRITRSGVVGNAVDGSVGCLIQSLTDRTQFSWYFDELLYEKQRLKEFYNGLG